MTLQKFRTADNGDVDFGQNMTARNSGIIRVGDNIEVLATKPSRPYHAGTVVETLSVTQDHTHAVTIDYNGVQFTGNNQQVLLEQLEQQNIRIPYSCRAGICGSCKITLVEGEVAPLKQSAIAENGVILSCSCIPKGNLTLTGK
ncbi:hypothetical protein yruck0001_17340 [Yersinia ruckeri ATCC 29473]|nr:hypothetical protein yruck0001_17340 [Yersinia ruckeri ATCC 29473]